jgi:ATP-dependent exoDNAse (exonuclease V) alpha subunit
VIGEAGTGKTFVTLAAAEGWAQAGMELRAAAPTWRAANVMRSDGLQAISAARLLSELDRAEHKGEVGLARGSVLLVDEAGMVDSATLARLVSHAERAKAKLVLIGDPEQLGEIGTGGLFRAVADRTEPIQLHEVIRHEHELDREAAKRVREGEGREALGLYVAENRVTVAPDAEARREAMVRDWSESYERGEDAMMIAKQNAEVARLNELARALRRQSGQLGADEIEVGEARFAAGDQVITRVNDQRAEIFNRERWQITEVDAQQHRVVLEGIDQAKRVEVGAEYLSRTNPYSEAPALEHAYAVTTYSAQGSTVERAFVAVDPSMDSRSSTSRHPAAARRPTSMRLLRFRPTARRPRQPPSICEKPSRTSLKQPSATAHSSQRTRSRCARASVACRPRSWSQGETISTAQRFRRESLRNGGTASKSGSKGAMRALSATERKEKQPKRCRATSARTR